MTQTATTTVPAIAAWTKTQIAALEALAKVRADRFGETLGFARRIVEIEVRSQGFRVVEEKYS